jgi:hypothetical protein
VIVTPITAGLFPKVHARARDRDVVDLNIDLGITGQFTSPMGLLWLVTLVGVCFVFGCAGRKPAANEEMHYSADARNQNLIVTPENALSGKILKVNAEGRFVVLNFPIGKLPFVGQRLNVYRHNLKVGEVKVTGPQREDNIVADISAGEAEPGDDVRNR